MNALDFFFNNAGRLRSGWRFVLFVVAYLIVFRVALLGVFLASIILSGNSPATVERIFDSNWGFVIQGIVLLLTATVLGWLFGRVMEDLPLRALGWSFHRGWLRDFAVGGLVGAVSVAAPFLLAAALGGFRFAPNFTSASLPAVALTFCVSAIVFIIGAAAEEALFRGYALQTLMRSWPVWIALLPPSLLFAYVHLNNPNINSFTFLNTALAGAWLTVAYAKTRSLWFPLGAHWTWNWTMGAIIGSPVSGIVELTPDPVFRAIDRGPEWLSGGDYGIEGGATCTLALILSTLFLWRTRLIGATEGMKHFTDSENPSLPTASITNFESKPNEPPTFY